MDPGDLRELLEQVRAGKLDIEAALGQLEQPAVKNLGYAHVDLHRRERCGFRRLSSVKGKPASGSPVSSFSSLKRARIA